MIYNHVANFVNCDMALDYYNDNCASQGAMITDVSIRRLFVYAYRS